MVEFYMQELKLVNCEIKRIYDENASILKNPDFEAFDARLKEHIRTFTKDVLLKKKEDKMSRDKLAFAGKYAYNWPLNNDQRGGCKYAGPQKNVSKQIKR